MVSTVGSVGVHGPWWTISIPSSSCIPCMPAGFNILFKWANICRATDYQHLCTKERRMDVLSEPLLLKLFWHDSSLKKKLSHFYLSCLLGTMMRLHTSRYQYRCSQRTFQDSNDSECWLTTSPCLCCLGGGKWNIPTRWQVNWAMFHIVSGPDRPQLWVKNNPSFWVFHSTDKCKVGVHGDLETNSRFWWAYRGGLMEVQWGFI